ncbi:hypothetical protein PIB30_054527 [Stylosanthes scabra]|uniref:Uncharacterized protein n=1 Tax=Stylosanthes scabra TaxID=79078 RepID=A0ABU6WH63_9FABA|nr:hypothetical protein [Stylosanthes scabra]
MCRKEHDEQMVINVFKAMQYPREEDAEGYMKIDIVEELIMEVQQEEAMKKFQAKQARESVQQSACIRSFSKNKICCHFISDKGIKLMLEPRSHNVFSIVVSP